MISFRKAVVVLCLVGVVFLVAEYYHMLQKPMMEKPLESGITTSVDTTVALTDNVPDVDDSDEARAVVTVHNTSTRISTITPEPPKLQLDIGKVNYDIWRWMSGYLVDDMRLWWNFPKYPEERKTLTTLTTSYSERTGESNFKGKYAHKVYGYILPKKSGSYVFQIVMTEVACGCEVELWVSTSRDPMEMKKLAFLEHVYQGSFSSQLSVSSDPIKLSANHSYYFEFLEKAFDGGVVVEIKWKVQDSEEFVTIPSSSLAQAVSLSSTTKKDMENDLPSSKLQRHNRVSSVLNHFGAVTNLDILPPCEFAAIYAYKHFVPKYGGVGEVVYSKVYPFDGSNIPGNSNGDNPTVNQHLADQVNRLYGEALKKQYPRATHKLICMEETENRNQGSRFLLEMEVNMGEKDNIVYTSQYVYLPANSKTLCATSNFKWNADARVYLVVATKNIGKWAHQLLYNIEQIYAATKDDNFDLLFVDYESTDINLKETIESSSFKRCHYIPLQGKFSRAGGLQAALQYITDPNSIVMTMDLHLYIPVGFINSIRKHVVQGKMAYAPILVRLAKGYSEVNINGFWEIQGYGIYGMYKSDWTAIGGYNTNEYKFKWGGEDWDILDKVAGFGMESFRLRYPGFVHYFHTYGELWDNPRPAG